MICGNVAFFPQKGYVRWDEGIAKTRDKLENILWFSRPLNIFRNASVLLVGEVIKEQSPDSASLLPVRDKKVFVAPLFECAVQLVILASILQGCVEVSRVLLIKVGWR